MSSRSALTLVSLLVAALAGCAQAPVLQVRHVSKAFEQLNGATQPLLDDLAIAERKQGQAAALVRARNATNLAAVAPADTRGAAGAPPKTPVQRCRDVTTIGEKRDAILRGFCTEDSYYYAELEDPPATRAFRRGLQAVGDYTELLVLLAENRNLDEAKAQVGTLAQNLGAVAAVAGFSGTGTLLGTAVKAFDPLLELAGRDANRNELERVVREVAPKADQLIERLREAAPELFNTLTEVSYRRLSSTDVLKNPALAAPDRERIEAYRLATSNYVVLLDRYRDVLRELVSVYDGPKSSVTMADLAARSADMSARAEAWRRSFALLRTGLN